MLFFDMMIKLYMVALGARLFLPQISPFTYNPLQRGLHAATEPVLRPLRQIVPRGREGFDWSPLVAILLLVVLRGILMSAVAGLPFSAGILRSILDITTFVVSVLAVLFLGVFFISIGTPFGYSRIGHVMVVITTPLLNPLRRVFGRGRSGSDPAALVGIVVLGVLQGLLLYQLITMSGGTAVAAQNVSTFILMGVGNLAGTILDILFYIILIRAILSWFSPDESNLLYQVIILYSDPILSPIRRIMPWTYGIDFSPLIAIMIILFIRSSLLPLLSQL